MLRRLGFLFPVDHRNVRDMDIDEVALAHIVAELGQGLDERHALDISNRTTLPNAR